MRTGGDEGAAPDWYPLIRAARYLRVPPWELAERSSVWVSWALMAEAGEATATREGPKQQGFNPPRMLRKGAPTAFMGR